MAASHADAGGLDITLYGAMAKSCATDVATKVTTEAIQILGG
jgi:alkylation response protein AidB-like acyl-CoA dehydrogenase